MRSGHWALSVNSFSVIMSSSSLHASFLSINLHRWVCFSHLASWVRTFVMAGKYFIGLCFVFICLILFICKMNLNDRTCFKRMTKTQQIRG